MNSKKISWLFCTNNVNYKTFKTIDSCLNQTYKNFEIIIVLNGDNLDVKKKLILEKYNLINCIKIIQSEFIGLSTNLNIGLHFCKYEYVARIDNGDISHHSRLEKQLNILEKNNNIAVVGSNYNIVNSEKIISKSTLPLNNSEIRHILKTRNPICHPSVMFRTDLIKKIGGYPKYRYAQDYGLWRELSRNKKIEFMNLEEYLLNYDYESESNSRFNNQSYSIILIIYITEFLFNFNFTKIIFLLKNFNRK